MGHECPDCTFVANRESIFIDRQTRERVAHKPICVGLFTLPNWSGHLKFYLCRCSCGKAFVDYPHGYTNGGYLFFSCDGCETIVLICDEAIYKESGTKFPTFLPKALLLPRLLWRRLIGRRNKSEQLDV